MYQFRLAASRLPGAGPADLAAAGTLVVDGLPVAVTGTAWFDHQWGDFIAVGGGGWDWFAVNLDDGTDLTVSLVRGADGADSLVYGILNKYYIVA